jgi:hypothetical protein
VTVADYVVLTPGLLVVVLLLVLFVVLLRRL